MTIAGVATAGPHTHAAADVVSGTFPVARGGTGFGAIAINSLIYASGTNVLSALAPGTNTNVLTMVAGVPTWAAPGTGGTVTDVTVGTGLDVSLSTTTPDITLSLDELAERSGALVGTDRIVGISGTTHWAETISGIPLSIFSNDLPPLAPAAHDIITLHTASGLTTGHVLRATGATTFAFQALVAGDLPSHTHAASDVTAGTFGVGAYGFRQTALSVAIGVRLSTGDVDNRFEVLAEGKIQFGDGTAATDVNLYRAAVGVLRTDTDLLVGGDLRVNGNIGIGKDPAASIELDIVGDIAATGTLTWGGGSAISSSNDVSQTGHTHAATDITAGTFGAGVYGFRQTALSVAIGVRLSTGDVANRFEVLAEGKVQFGDGTAAIDVNLYRAAVGVLRTDTDFLVGGDLRVNSQIGIGKDAAAGVELDIVGDIAATGTLKWGGGAAISSSNNVSQTGHTHAAADVISGTFAVARGGTGLGSIAINSLIYASAANVFSALAPGTDTHILTMASGVPVWAAPVAGPAAAGTLTGTILASNVVTSSLTSVATLTSLHVSGAFELDGALNHDGTTIGFFAKAPATKGTLGAGLALANTGDATYGSDFQDIEDLVNEIKTLLGRYGLA